MYYHQDWVLRQIQVLINFIRKILNKKEVSMHTSEEDYEIKVKVERLIDDYQYDKAKILVLEYINDGVNIDAALCFFEKLNSLSDEELERGGFTRESILADVTNICIQNNLIDTYTIDFLINSGK